jgi:hypothetical protein
MGGTDHQLIDHSGASLAEAKILTRRWLGISPPIFLPFLVSSNQRCDYALIIPCKDGCFDRGFIMRAKMKIFIIMSIVVCFYFGCASTSKKTWVKCPNCGTTTPIKEGAETFQRMSAEEEQPFSIMGVGSGIAKTLSDSNALTVHNIVGQGTASATIGDKAFNNLIWEFATVLRTVDGYTIGRGYYKFTTPNGHYFMLEATGTVLEGGTWNILHGTGGWSGITGQGNGRLIIHGKPLPTETEQYRFRLNGRLRLPKWE